MSHMNREHLQSLLNRKQWAYRVLFNTDDERLNEAAKIVMADLRETCHATKTSFSTEALEMARREGRREVFNHMMQFLKVDFEDYYELVEESYE